MPLNDRQIRNAKPATKPYKLADGLFCMQILLKTGLTAVF